MKAHAFFFCLPPFFLALSTKAQLNSPKIGIVRYLDSTVHTIFGLHNNFVVTPEALGTADEVSFSDAGGLLAKGGHIRLMDAGGKPLAEFESGESAPLVNIDGGLVSAIAWLPARHSLLHWDGKSFAVVETNSPLLSRVTAVRVESAKIATLLLLENGGTVSEASLSLETGNLLSLKLLPGVRGPAFAQYSFVLFEDERGLEVQGANGAVRTLPITAADLTIERASSDWLHISSSATGQNWILHLNRTALQLAELPPPAAGVIAAAELSK